MENIEQPNLKGAVFSWASLAGITFSRVAAAAAMAFGGQGLSRGAGSRGSAAAEGLQLQPRCWGSGSGPSQGALRLQPGAGSCLLRWEPACGCLHPSAQTYPEMSEIPMGYFE